MKFAASTSVIAFTSLIICICCCASDPSGLKDGEITVIEPDHTTTWYHAAQYPKTVVWSRATGHQIRAYIYNNGDFVALAHIWTNHDGEGSFTRNISSWGTGDRYQIRLEDSDGNSGWSEYFTIAEQPGNMDTLFFDDFERSCPSDWGTPVIGGTYTYINPGGAIFTVAEGVGYIDDETIHKDGRAQSYLVDSAMDMVSFSWKYQADISPD